ncbi:MAG: aminopeptidase P family protein [Pseudomonadota bacterium]
MFQSFEITADSSESAARLASLREKLAGMGAGGMLVPRGDAHQGETVAPSDERLAWLTGFTGSAGLAIVTSDRAALFIDGRYTLQAADQADTSAFEIVAVHETEPTQWAASALGTGRDDDAMEAGLPLGYDPWLHGEAEIARYEKALGRPLLPLPENPIDAIWADRPPAPAGSVSIHAEALAGESAASKRQRLGQTLTEEGVAAAVITMPDSLCWLLNIRGSDLARSPVAQGFGVLHADGRVDLFMAPEKIGGAVSQHLGNGVTVAPVEAMLPALGELGAVRVRADRSSCPLAVLRALEVGGSEIDWGRDPCVLPKALKNDAELDGMRAAHRRDGAALCRFLAWLDGALASGETVDEITVARRIEEFRRATGALLDIAFDTIAGAGPNGAIVHYRVNEESNRQIVPGELLLIDSGGQYRDGTTDVTRTLSTGEGTPPEARHAFTLVLKGMIAVATARWPAGLTGRDLDPLARIALWRQGLDYDHGTGHGVGAYLNVHEGPASLSRRGGDVALEPGMVLSDEPGCYRQGAWGIRIENLLAVSRPSVPEGGQREMLGFETLTLVPIDRRLIVPDVLGGAERAWLDAYHARVRAEIGPLLDGPEDGAVRDWLDAATVPLDA